MLWHIITESTDMHIHRMNSRWHQRLDWTNLTFPPLFSFLKVIKANPWFWKMSTKALRVVLCVSISTTTTTKHTWSRYDFPPSKCTLLFRAKYRRPPEEQRGDRQSWSERDKPCLLWAHGSGLRSRCPCFSPGSHRTGTPPEGTGTAEGHHHDGTLITPTYNLSTPWRHPHHPRFIICD